MEARNSSETSVNFYHPTPCNNLEDGHLNIGIRENLKSHPGLYVFIFSRYQVRTAGREKVICQRCQVVLGSARTVRCHHNVLGTSVVNLALLNNTGTCETSQ
jgi:hypothetical protein